MTAYELAANLYENNGGDNSPITVRDASAVLRDLRANGSDEAGALECITAEDLTEAYNSLI